MIRRGHIEGLAAGAAVALLALFILSLVRAWG